MLTTNTAGATLHVKSSCHLLRAVRQTPSFADLQPRVNDVCTTTCLGRGASALGNILKTKNVKICLQRLVAQCLLQIAIIWFVTFTPAPKTQHLFCEHSWSDIRPRVLPCSRYNSSYFSADSAKAAKDASLESSDQTLHATTRATLTVALAWRFHPMVSVAWFSLALPEVRRCKDSRASSQPILPQRLILCYIKTDAKWQPV